QPESRGHGRILLC
nr:immunoglobulin heavy chain junction region [Homo sapiens]MBN4554207.1 immunoglobulin heavy chain junction region [Homo sapiens]MBN4576027.1 immunoglobulin heavy chain junction region [Homo sapiens]